MITVPTQLYVGLMKRDDADVPLGFATPYEDNAAFRKRKESVDAWAQPRSMWNQATKSYVQPPSLDPRIIDNTPAEGFQISKSVRRTGWNGGNVVWRLEDPRGFELEISSANFAAIVNHCTIKNGTIKGKCVWGREAAQNVLLPEGSEPYKEAFKATVRVATKVNKKDFKPGDLVQLKDGREVTYMGEFDIVGFEYLSNWNYGNRTESYELVTRKRHVILTTMTEDTKNRWRYKGVNIGDPIFQYMSAIHVTAVVEQRQIKGTAEATAELITKSFSKADPFNIDSGKCGHAAMAVVPSKKEKPSMLLKPTAYSDIVFDTTNGDRLFGVYEGMSGGYVMFVEGSTYGSGRGHYVNVECTTGKVIISEHTDRYNHLSHTNNCKWHKIVVSYGGKEYDVKV